MKTLGIASRRDSPRRPFKAPGGIFGSQLPGWLGRLAVLAGCLLPSAAGAAELDEDLTPVALNVGFIRSCFLNVNFVGKPALAVLPVFFGKRPACLMDEFSFGLMGELNPQVGEELQSIATSEAFVDNVVCVGDRGWPTETVRRDILETLGGLHNDPVGRQILILFKVGRMVPFEATQLATVQALRAKYERLRKEIKP